KSDGTSAGTSLIIQGARQMSDFTNAGGTLYFVTGDDATGTELWKTDGTPVGTMMVKDILPGFDSSYPNHLTNVNGLLLFVAYAPGNVLWISDGTEAGTIPISPGEIALDNTELAGVNGTLYFSALRR